MGWKRKTLIGTASALVLGWVGLSYATREFDRPVTHLAASGRLLLTGATIVDPGNGALAPGMSILMDAGRITAVGPDATMTAQPGTSRVDARGKFIVPGFNDMHAHPLGQDDPSGDLALMLANGVTGFRQMSGSDAILTERRESRLPITQDSPALLIMPGSLLTPLNASKPDQVRETVRLQKAGGADFIKAGLVDGPNLFAALDEGRRVGISVSGHVPAGTNVLVAAQRGMRAIEHLGPANGLLIACSRDGDRILADVAARTKVPHLPAINSHIVEKLAEWALLKKIVNPSADHEPGAVEPLRRAISGFDEAKCHRVAQRLKAAGNWQVPTLIRLKTTVLADDPAFARDPDLRYMPPGTVKAWRDVSNTFTNGYSPAEHAMLRQGYDFSLRLVKILDDEGVGLLAGSDASGAGWEVPGFALHHEFDELGRTGLTPLRILQMTTSDAARFLGRTATMGSVAPDRNADLVLLDGDPTKDVANLHRIAGVVRAGFYYDAAKLAALKQRVAAGKGYIR